MLSGRRRIPHAITYLVLSLWALTTIYPFIWVILNSFRKKGLIMSDSFSLPLGDAFTWENYLTAWQRADFKNAYLNSFLISGTVTVFVVLIAGLAAYGLVRYRFRGRGVLYSLIMAGMMFPVFSTIIPVFRMEAVMGIAGTGKRWLSLLAVILPQIAGNLCFAIIILMGFTKFRRHCQFVVEVCKRTIWIFSPCIENGLCSLLYLCLLCLSRCRPREVIVNDGVRITISHF